MSVDKRLSHRHVIELPMQYREISESVSSKKVLKARASAKTKNLSDGGLLFLSKKHYKKGTVLELKLPVKDRFFVMKGRVVYSVKDPATHQFKTGVCFSRASEVFKVKMAEQMHKIEQFRKRLSRTTHKVIPEEEAAQKWILKNSVKFSKFYAE